MIKKWFRNLLMISFLSYFSHVFGQESCGYFSLYYAPPEDGLVDFTTAEKDVICQVFTDMSVLIEVVGTPNVRIEVKAKDLIG